MTGSAKVGSAPKNAKEVIQAECELGNWQSVFETPTKDVGGSLKPRPVKDEEEVVVVGEPTFLVRALRFLLGSNPSLVATEPLAIDALVYTTQFSLAWHDDPRSTQIGPTSVSPGYSLAMPTLPSRPMTLEQFEAWQARMRRVDDGRALSDGLWDRSQSVFTSDGESHGLMLRSLLTRADAETHAAFAEHLAPWDALLDPGIQEVTGGRTTGAEFTDGALFLGTLVGPEFLPASLTRAPVLLDPRTVAFTQSWVSRQKYGAALDFDGLVASMSTNGWLGDPIDVVRMADGTLATIDNTRVLAARQAGIDVLANVRAYDDIIEDPLRAFQLAVGDRVPTTWGEAAVLRINRVEQNIASRNGGVANWSQRFPNGSLYDPYVWP